MTELDGTEATDRGANPSGFHATPPSPSQSFAP